MDFNNSILLQADDFYEAYLRCIEGKNKKVKGNTTSWSVVNIPAVVNASFACELYFKSLIGKELKSHNLIGFYNKLSRDIKNELQEHYKYKKVGDCKTICQAINEVKNTFVEWRYLYKDEFKEQCNPKDLNRFLWIFATITPILKEVAHTHSS